MSLPHDILSAKFDELQMISGNSFADKMSKLGFIYKGKAERASSLDEFKAAVEESDYADEEKLIKFFGEYLSYKDVSSLLRLGENGFTQDEIREAFKIIPCTATIQISVRDLIALIYK